MKCPRDHTACEHTVVNGQQVYRCPDCQGYYLPGSSIDPLLGEGELLKLRSLCSVKQSDLVCPFDHSPLGTGKIAGVPVDFCLECNSLWLDWGELQLLQKRIPITSAGRVTREEVATAQSTADAALIAALLSLGS